MEERVACRCGRPDLAPAKSAILETGTGRGALLADDLALGAAQGREEVVEARISAVEPMVLDSVGADQPAAALASAAAASSAKVMCPEDRPTAR